MPSGKRESERKGNRPVNTDPSPNMDERANNTVEEVNEPARGSGSLHWEPVRELTPSVYRGAYYCPPPAFRPEMDSVEWLERLEDFLCISRVPPPDHGVVARYLLSDPEFKKRLLGAYGPQESTGQLIERFQALHQREGQTIEQYAQEVAEIRCRAGVSERDLLARFAWGITSKEAYLAIRLQEPATLTEARRLVSKVMRAEEDFHQRRQSHTGNPKPEKTEATQSIDDLIREVRKVSMKLEKQEPTAVRHAARRHGCFICGGLGHLRRDCPPESHAAPRRNQRPPTGTQSGFPGNLWPDCKQAKRHIASGGDPLERKMGTIVLADGRRMCISGVGVVSLQLGRWRARVPVMVVRNLVIPGDLGTNFFDSFVRTVDWQNREITMTDGSKLWIEHDPAQAGQPGIGSAVMAKLRGVGSDAGTGADGPEGRQIFDRSCSSCFQRLHCSFTSCGKGSSHDVPRCHRVWRNIFVRTVNGAKHPTGSKMRNTVLNNDRFDSPPGCSPSPEARSGLLEADLSSSGTDVNALGSLLAHLCKWKPPLANSSRISPASSFASLIVSHDVARSSTYMFSKISAAARGAASCSPDVSLHKKRHASWSCSAIRTAADTDRANEIFPAENEDEDTEATV
ncbi:hypothetical protein T05_7745 [Trichinella murrelli]|uniref:CCHC-type domain-containing protein n=1 Tax=Trichinella murrelli TaxID=144512 RepID=A0A0V0TFZ3_9BILA|nr:hypothetical protein T05_7745 [Trichinella murrelli]